jgi:glycerophosphoryl diester phosphodiesterase
MLDDRFLRSARPTLWGHRGASRDAPENTLAAFELAARQGADGVELDAQRCASGEVVVFHDVTLGRTTGRPGLLEETPWQVLRTLDAGARKDRRFAGERIPLLAEVFAQTDPGLLVNVELKCDRSDDRGLTAEVIRTIDEARAQDRVLLSSFNPFCLARARALAPGLPRALLFEEDAGFLLRGGKTAPLLGVQAVHPQASLATAAAIQSWRRRGYAVACWTVDDPAVAARLHREGAVGIITNAPGALLASFAPAARPEAL